MLYVIISVLIALVLFLFVWLLLLKKEMRHISLEMKENEDRRQMNIELVDGDLQSMITEVNKLYEEILRVKIDTMKEEDRLKESVSMISHDMRTPLTSIIGYLQVAQRSEDEAEVEQNIEIALERAKYLNKLVNDFFEISLIDSEQVDINMERVNLCEIICEEILAESPEIDRKGLEPSFEQADENIYVNADKEKLVRIIQNLISNAVRYSDKRLEFKIVPEVDGMTRMKIITDPGAKIDTDNIFNRFVKGDSARSNGGAGLGLYICKGFAEMMGGDIKASQDEESFTITLSLQNLKD